MSNININPGVTPHVAVTPAPTEPEYGNTFAYLHDEFSSIFPPNDLSIEPLSMENLLQADAHLLEEFQSVNRGRFASMAFPADDPHGGMVASLDDGFAVAMRGNNADGRTVAVLAHVEDLPQSEHEAQAILQPLRNAMVAAGVAHAAIHTYVVGGSEVVPGGIVPPLESQIDGLHELLAEAALGDFGLTGGYMPARSADLLSSVSPILEPGEHTRHVAQVFVNHNSIRVLPCIWGYDSIPSSAPHPTQIALAPDDSSDEADVDSSEEDSPDTGSSSVQSESELSSNSEMDINTDDEGHAFMHPTDSSNRFLDDASRKRKFDQI